MRFHRTIAEEFYQIAFRKKIYNSIAQLQQVVDEWTDSYNCTRPHSGRYCYGKTPLAQPALGMADVSAQQADCGGKDAGATV